MSNFRLCSVWDNDLFAFRLDRDLVAVGFEADGGIRDVVYNNGIDAFLAQLGTAILYRVLRLCSKANQQLAWATLGSYFGEDIRRWLKVERDRPVPPDLLFRNFAHLEVRHGCCGDDYGCFRRSRESCAAHLCRCLDLHHFDS